MGKAIVTTKMTDSQPNRIADRLIPYFQKKGVDLPKDAVQIVLDKEMEHMLEEMFEVFRRRVDAKLSLAPRDTFTILLSQRHDLHLFFRDRPGSPDKPGLSVWPDFEHMVASVGPTEIGTSFALSSFDSMSPLNHLEIEMGIEGDYLFDESQVCATIAYLITAQPHKLATNLGDNLFFLASSVVTVGWSCTSHVWHIMSLSGRDNRKRIMGNDRVFCLKPRRSGQ